ncbi:hypothetical protein BROOK1789C_2046, partial [Bathymodiolus brooksi thiotrophic gill symbiont]
TQLPKMSQRKTLSKPYAYIHANSTDLRGSLPIF